MSAAVPAVGSPLVQLEDALAVAADGGVLACFANAVLDGQLSIVNPIVQHFGLLASEIAGMVPVS
jgi:hypothetical protein